MRCMGVKARMREWRPSKRGARLFGSNAIFMYRKKKTKERRSPKAADMPRARLTDKDIHECGQREQDAEDNGSLEEGLLKPPARVETEIGRASCRERG